jgi:hypothetical protein
VEIIITRISFNSFLLQMPLKCSIILNSLYIERERERDRGVNGVEKLQTHVVTFDNLVAILQNS